MPFVDAEGDELAKLAYRLWRLSRESLRARYEQAGVPVVEWVDGDAARRRARGGDGIQAPRPTRARLALALAVGGRVRGRVRVRRDARCDDRAVDGCVRRHGRGAARCLHSWRRADDVLPWALVLAGVAYAVPLFVRGRGVDEGAPLVAAGLLLCGELAAWSFDERWAIRAERAVVLARARRGRPARARRARRVGARARARRRAGRRRARVDGARRRRGGRRRRPRCAAQPLGAHRYTDPRSRAHSSSGLGHRPLTAAARVRIPYAPLR